MLTINRLRLATILGITTLAASCDRPHTLFHTVSGSSSGIHFNNRIEESDSINPIDLEFLYNGGGVAVGDFNNDSLPDLYFTASTVSNKLYLNKGHLTFADVTDEAQVGGEGRWCNGASVVDINNDGRPDIYVCTTIRKNPAQRRNLLYINQGPDKNGVPVFREQAVEYGLADTSYSVQAAFFDYDHDGDLDMYLATTMLATRNGTQFSSNGSDPSKNTVSVDKLFRNDWSDSLQHPVFTDVSRAAGIVEPGFGLGLTVSDLNGDGWPDVYVSNDFFTSDCMYINNRNGTFTNRLRQDIRHSSQNAMGNDVADINNDGLPDIITVDMNPPDNYRKKKNMGGNNYFVYQSMIYNNYALQYVRNTLQLNFGPVKERSDSLSDPQFGDISFYAGVAQTDWSWNPSLADFDNDGWRDLIITNGYPRDVTDRDFGAFRERSGPQVSKQELLDQIPQIKIPNYAFKNNRHLKFDDVTKDWGLNSPSFSNGAVYVDLDRDGDLDYVVNNINQEAFVYENTLTSTAASLAHFLDLRFTGAQRNREGFGATVTIYSGGRMQRAENYPVRGYLSSVAPGIHFGLGNATTVDSLIVTWPEGRHQRLNSLHADQALTLNFANAQEGAAVDDPSHVIPYFTNVTDSTGIAYVQNEVDYIDFNYEKLLPHKLSEYGPPLAAGDLDGNGLEDIFVGATAGFPGNTIFLQQPNGRFAKKVLPTPDYHDVRLPENMGMLIFDADGDGDNDIYLASGSNEFAPNTKNYQDRLLVNDGKGNLTWDTTALPINFTSKSCVKAADYDHDGDLDLFVGGRVLPGRYPQPVSSFVYRNDSRPGHPKFTDVTADVAPSLNAVGLVCDAVWTDFDNDGAVDLILVGEWMPIRFLKNQHNRFTDVTAGSGIADQSGWWNSIASGDFDNDGDMDYIAGNLGQNSFYQASDSFPVRLYAKDFDRNGSIDPVLTVYLPGENGARAEFPVASRDDIAEQMPALKKKFLHYRDYGKASFADVFDKAQLDSALVLHANNFASCYIENKGNGKFALHALPPMAQLSTMYGILPGDFNADGNLDVLTCGNDYGTEVTNGRYDASPGVLLLGNGHGAFESPSLLQSGFFVPGNSKALLDLRGAGNSYLVVASQNKGALRAFKSTQSQQQFPLQPLDAVATVTLKDGRKRKQELVYGSSFLSQSSRSIAVAQGTWTSIDIVDTRGNHRVITPH